MFTVKKNLPMTYFTPEEFTPSATTLYNIIQIAHDFSKAHHCSGSVNIYIN